MECVIHNIKIKYEDGEMYSYIKWGRSKNYKWFLLKGSIDKETGYKRVNINNKKYQYHRVIYKLYNPDWNINDYSKNNFIDHIDRNRLNNNIDNLRVVTKKQNDFNKNGKGYYWHKPCNKWCVQIMLNRKCIYGGLFINEEDAIKRREEMKEKYHKIN